MIYIVPQTPPKGILLIKQIRKQELPNIGTAEVLIGRNVVKENWADMRRYKLNRSLMRKEQGSCTACKVQAADK